jgi:hypothetical protein
LHGDDLATDEVQIVNVMGRVGEHRPGTRLAPVRGVEIIACFQQHPLRRYRGDAADAAGLNDLPRPFDDGIVPPVMTDKERHVMLLHLVRL